MDDGEQRKSETCGIINGMMNGIKSLLKSELGVLLAALSFAACAASPVYAPKDVEVASDAIKCRPSGWAVLDGDAFQKKDFWKFGNYENRIGIEPGGVRDGVKGLCLDGSAKSCDTAWSARSVRSASCRRGGIEPYVT